jgi:hypothetical protein
MENGDGKRFSSSKESGNKRVVLRKHVQARKVMEIGNSTMLTQLIQTFNIAKLYKNISGNKSTQ